ncbi:hypothetical protein IFM89_028740 [Coptis chinensis]|uniref:Patellin-4 n=1 Tax=Coptis chinensis TaxID=261450 RepID=A0A835GYG4_9MAGN|nr:hypothetical protein IFM89_028740 [Coptis chinensis]
MTAELKSADTQMPETSVNDSTKVVEVKDVVVEGEKDAGLKNEAVKVEEKNVEDEVDVEKKNEEEVVVPSVLAVEKSSSFKEESSIFSDLKEFEKKALSELKEKVEEVILENKIFKKKEVEKVEKPKEEENEKPIEEEGGEEKEKVEEVTKPIETTEEKADEEVIDKEISLWGVPLLPSKCAVGTDVVLLKFLRARDFKVNEALEMLIKTLQWRKEYKSDSLLDEDISLPLDSVAYMDGLDREGHPICYNVYGGFQSDDLYQKTFGTEEQRGVCSLLQINDLKNTPGPSKKEFRVATKQAVELLQDNYPEFVARNIFINVPFWYYAFNALLSPFLTQRTKSKFFFARPASVTETLLKYIPAELIVKSGSTETIEIPIEVGTYLVWDLTVLGWEVTYKEEFVPNDEGSYTIIVNKAKKKGSTAEAVRNTFSNNEPGKVVLTIENGSFKKKRVLYRYKVMQSSS